MIPAQLIAPGQLTDPGVNLASVHGLTPVTVHMRFLLPRDDLERRFTHQGFIYWGGGGGASSQKSFTEKKLQLFQIKIFFEDDFKESVKDTNVQKCDFSQS